MIFKTFTRAPPLILLLQERLEAILEVLERVLGRFEKVKTPQDFVFSDEKFALSPAAAFAIIPN